MLSPSAQQPSRRLNLHAPARQPCWKVPAGSSSRQILGIGVGDVDPPHRQRPATALALARVVLGRALDAEDLQPAAFAEPVRVAGQEAVEARAAPRARVLRLIDDPAVLVGGERLVHEAAHRPQRLAVAALAAPAPRHLEHVAVRLGVAPGGVGEVRAEHGLLAGQPAPTVQPEAAGAVDVAARERDEVAHERARARVVVERAGSAARRRVVGAGIVRHAARAGRVAVLVVADQPHRAARAAERGHAVERQRREVAVGHPRGDVAEA